MLNMLVYYFTYFSQQVGFGSEFSETWDDKSLGLKRAKGTGKLTFLIPNIFKGLMKLQTNPFFQVRALNVTILVYSYLVKACYPMLISCLYDYCVVSAPPGS